MTLASILEVCLLIASPSMGSRIVPVFLIAQSGPTQQETTPANPQPPALEPQQDSPPAPAQSSPPASSPAEKPSNSQVQPDQAPATQTAPTQPAEDHPPASSTETRKPVTPKKKPATAAANQPKKPRRKHPAVSQAPAGPPKVVVKNGGAADPAVKISPGESQQQASSQRQSSGELLASTDANLKKISGRQLTSSQQDMVKQIQQYMEQAKVAGDAGDLEREHNFALKADLLSEELVKH